MKRNNGQALVEFVIILPLVIYILIGVIDFIMIFYNKNSLESKMSDVVTMYKNNDSETEISDYLNKDDQNVVLKVEIDNKYTTLIITKKQNILAPGLDKILGDPYSIKVERVISNEQ